MKGARYLSIHLNKGFRGLLYVRTGGSKASKMENAIPRILPLYIGKGVSRLLMSVAELITFFGYPI